MNLSNLGKEIKNLRKENHMTQENLANEVGISRATLSKLENGYLANVSIATFNNILSVLGYELKLVKKNPFIS